MRKISALLFATLVVCVFALILWTSLDFQQCIKSYGNIDPATEHLEKGLSVFVGRFQPYRHCVGAYVTDNNAAITALGTLVIAVFTTVLGVFTISLASSTRIAADAAKAAAEHIPTVEGAFIHVLLVGDMIGAGLDIVENGQSYSPPEIQISLKNYGKTPGFIERFNAKLRYISADYQSESELVSILPNTIIGSGDGFPSLGGLAIAIKGLTAAQATAVKNGAGAIILVGTLIYTDIWDSEWNVPFDGRYVAALGSFRLDNQSHKRKE